MSNLFAVIAGVLLLIQGGYYLKKYYEGYGLPIMRVRQFKEFYGFVPTKEVKSYEKLYLLYSSISLLLLGGFAFYAIVFLNYE